MKIEELKPFDVSWMPRQDTRRRTQRWDAIMSSLSLLPDLIMLGVLDIIRQDPLQTRRIMAKWIPNDPVRLSIPVTSLIEYDQCLEILVLDTKASLLMRWSSWNGLTHVL
jgi:hypothetical protein